MYCNGDTKSINRSKVEGDSGKSRRHPINRTHEMRQNDPFHSLNNHNILKQIDQNYPLSDI